jgi:hypothetical protein
LTNPDDLDEKRNIDHSKNLDEMSVVMSICTQNIGKTGISESTKNTAARLLERLKNPDYSCWKSKKRSIRQTNIEDEEVKISFSYNLLKPPLPELACVG